MLEMSGDKKPLDAGKIRHECRAGTVERLLLEYFGQKISQSGRINEATELEKDGMGIYDADKLMDSQLICKFLIPTGYLLHYSQSASTPDRPSPGRP